MRHLKHFSRKGDVLKDLLFTCGTIIVKDNSKGFNNFQSYYGYHNLFTFSKVLNLISCAVKPFVSFFDLQRFQVFDYCIVAASIFYPKENFNQRSHPQFILIMKRIVSILGLVVLISAVSCNSKWRKEVETYTATNPITIDTSFTKEYVSQIRSVKTSRLERSKRRFCKWYM
jgi:hypothetical protein